MHVSIAPSESIYLPHQVEFHPFQSYQFTDHNNSGHCSVIAKTKRALPAGLGTRFYLHNLTYCLYHRYSNTLPSESIKMFLEDTSTMTIEPFQQLPYYHCSEAA
jgi:hypothetical protein